MALGLFKLSLFSFGASGHAEADGRDGGRDRPGGGLTCLERDARDAIKSTSTVSDESLTFFEGRSIGLEVDFS